MFKFITVALPLSLLTLFTGCFSESGNETAILPSQGDNIGVFSCNSSTSRTPIQKHLKRLSKRQASNAIEDIAVVFANQTEADALMSFIENEITLIPKESDEHMNIFDHSVTQVHIESYIALAQKVSEFIESSTARKSQWYGACSSSQTDTVCTTSFIEKLGLHTFRKPLSQSQIDQYLQVYQDSAAGEGYANLISLFLSSPYFMFKIESGDPGAQALNGHLRLSQHEVAAKLGYFYLQSIPDEELFLAAKNNKLKTKSQITAQVDRLLALPKVRKRLTENFATEYLKLDKIPDLKTDTSSMATIVSQFQNTPTSQGLKSDLKKEVIDYFDYLIWEKKATFSELMTSDLIFPRTDLLAEIYGSSKWSGSYASDQLVRAPAGERSGLLTLANYLYTGIESTRPIIRGVHVYNDFLCGSLPAPADNDAPEGVVLKDHFTQIERVRAITEKPGTGCASCHTKIINPIGFAFEKFDSFGRRRTVENIYYPEESANKGQIIASTPVVDSVNFKLPGVENEESFDGAVDLIKTSANNAAVNACFARNLWRYANSTFFEMGENECASENLYLAGAKEGGSILDMFKSVAVQPEFLIKKVD